ncbi:MAG: Gfo/Idh/MocA family oxidoreductase [Pseudomonadota bacterium]
MAALKVATIGAGYFAQFHHAAWAEEPRAALVAVCDRDPVKAGAMAAPTGAKVYDDPAAMLDAERPDLVDIITPPATHLELIQLAAVRGIAVICQKAFCEDLGQAQRAVEIADRAGITLIVHENFRFSPWFVEMARLIEARQFGELYQITFRLRPGDGQGTRAYLDRQPYFQTMSRFLIHETAIHFIDTFRFLLGEPASVYADLRRLNPAIRGEDAGVMVFDFGSGVRALFDGNRLSDHVAENRRLTMGEMWLEGEKGTLHLSGDGDLSWRDFGSNAWAPHPYEWSRAGFAGNAVAALQSHVVAHLLDGAPAHNIGEDYLANLRVEDAVYRSAASGSRIDLTTR